MTRPHRRPVVRAATALAAGLLVVSACSGTDAPDEDDADATSTTADQVAVDFCVKFPTRDATLMLHAGDDPSLEGNPEMADDLLEIAADGVSNGVPADIAPAVEVYVAALRDHQPGADPLDDPDTRQAVDQINGWLGQHCGPPVGSTPPTEAPATSPP